MNETFYTRRGKRALDIALSFFGLVVFFPVLALAALSIALTGRGPVFFRQTRVGRFGRPFRIFKFRSMTWMPEAQGLSVTAARDPRITAIGRVLRRTKIDELPQLINVLRGEMSLVGPRPEMPQYTALYDDGQKMILSVAPGITSLASLHFSKEEELLAQQTDHELYYRSILLPAKLAMDYGYVTNVRLTTDIRLIFLTLAALFNFPGTFQRPLSNVNENPGSSVFPASK